MARNDDKFEPDAQQETRNIAMAEKLAGKLLKDHLEGKGKCPSSVIQYYLGLSGSAGRRERDRQEANNELTQKKAELIRTQQESNASAEEAKEALYRYRGKK